MSEDRVLGGVWRELGGDAAALAGVTIEGARHDLPSRYDVGGLAVGTVAAATLAVAEVAAARRGESLPGVTVRRRPAVAAFRSEALLTPLGWTLPPVWDPVAGDYPAADGWIRLHTNYAHHRAAALRALGLAAGADRAAVAASVRAAPVRQLEDAVVGEGGAAALLRTAAEWAAHPQGEAIAAAGLVVTHPAPDPTGGGLASAGPAPGLRLVGDGVPPLDGLRVLDLTRVIAGPVATRTLAAWGADVLRIDPPGFAEVPALLPDVTGGKHCAALDLHDPADRARFEELVARAHVVVHGLRPGALDGLGYDAAGLRALNPDLVTAAVDAYGTTGPWAGRRGFDSLVQLSTGIAAANSGGADADPQAGPRPVPLPAQALDHGAGQLVAAAACRALTELLRTGRPADVRVSLAGVAGLLAGLPAGPGGPPPAWDERDTAELPTGWGPARIVPTPGRIGGQLPRRRIPAGPLGRHPARFAIA